jgi:hypothetical protein
MIYDIRLSRGVIAMANSNAGTQRRKQGTFSVLYNNLHLQEGNRKRALEKALLLKRRQVDMSSIESFSEAKIDDMQMK